MPKGCQSNSKLGANSLNATALEQVSFISPSSGTEECTGAPPSVAVDQHKSRFGRTRTCSECSVHVRYACVAQRAHMFYVPPAALHCYYRHRSPCASTASGPRVPSGFAFAVFLRSQLAPACASRYLMLSDFRWLHCGLWQKSSARAGVASCVLVAKECCALRGAGPVHVRDCVMHVYG